LRFSCVVDVSANSEGAILRVNEYEGYKRVRACMCIYMCVCMHGSEWLMGGEGLVGWEGADCAAI